MGRIIIVTWKKESYILILFTVLWVLNFYFILQVLIILWLGKLSENTIKQIRPFIYETDSLYSISNVQ